MTAGRTAEQLQAEYVDPRWLQKFVDLTALIDILGDCIISNSYVISDELNAAIRLSDAGQSMLDKLTRKEKVNPKDARLMCALTLGHDELFVDVDAMDIDRLADAIHTGLSDQSLRFPFIYGRTLYDAYASTFEGEKDLLSNEETLRILNQLPPGVFQYGIFTVGPYGLRRSRSARNIPSSHRVPAYHCAVPACQAVHSVSLQTGVEAPINRDREKLEKLLQASGTEPSEWWALAARISGLTDAYYGDHRAGVLLPLIGDTLSDSELRALVHELLDTGKGELRESVASFLDVRAADDFVSSQNRAELLQLVLVAREEHVARSIDVLVRRRTILVPIGEVRRPVISRALHSGAFRLQAELGHRGIRFVSTDQGLALLRERRLLSKLYLRDSDGDVQELEWQLRGVDVEDLDEKLETFFHTRAPGDALARLVLARRTNMITACHEVGIEDGSEMADTELLESILWKLGFPIHTGDDPHEEFWQRHERLWALTQSSSIGTSERFLETAAPYFTRLEGLLLDSLAFTTWALLTDHTSSAKPFAYDDHDDRHAGLALLQSITSSEHQDGRTDFGNERVELWVLMNAFRQIAEHLEAGRGTPDLYSRPDVEYPSFDGKTDLKRFLFRSTMPFLDLSKPSQDRIIGGLKQISKTLVDGEVNQVHNDYSHFRRTAPDISRVELGLEAVRQSVTRIENLGFCRLLFKPSNVSADRWGQERHEFVGPRSYEHVFRRPTTLDWMGLPPLTEAQHLLRAASFEDPNEVLRFTRRYQSEFSEMWLGYPNRRRRGSTTPPPEEIPSHQAGIELSA